MKRRSTSFLKSLFFHALALALLLAWFRAPLAPQSRPNRSPIEVALSESSAKPAPSRGGGGGGKRRATPRTAPREIRLSDLGIGFDLARKSAPAPGVKTIVPKEELGNVDKYFAGRSNQLYQEIHARVDNELVYPKEFKDAFIDGSVKATLVFSKEGLLIRERSKFESSNPFLDVLVKRTLRRALESPLTAGAREAISGYETSVECFFRFAIMEGDDEEVRKERNFVSAGHISFFRLFQHSKLQWKAGPIEALGPLAGINPDWFVDKYNELIRGHAKIDPLDKWRDDPEW
ncbi:MAG: hypothetical protein ACXWP5_08085 [Bdellovibrionota bacterium]